MIQDKTFSAFSWPTLLLAVTVGCGSGFARDDTTSQTRMLVSELLGIPYDNVSPNKKLTDLGYKSSHEKELLVLLEQNNLFRFSSSQAFSIISQLDLENASVLELANAIREKNASGKDSG